MLWIEPIREARETIDSQLCSLERILVGLSILGLMPEVQNSLGAAIDKIKESSEAIDKAISLKIFDDLNVAENNSLNMLRAVLSGSAIRESQLTGEPINKNIIEICTPKNMELTD